MPNPGCESALKIEKVLRPLKDSVYSLEALERQFFPLHQAAHPEPPLREGQSFKAPGHPVALKKGYQGAKGTCASALSPSEPSPL